MDNGTKTHLKDDHIAHFLPREMPRFRRFVFLTIIVVFAATSGAQAQITTLELAPAEPLPRQLYVFNTDLLTAIAFKGVGYDSPQFEDAIRELRPQGLRFPGGTIANNYRWAEDSFSEPTNDKTEWAAEQLRLFRKIGRPYDFPGFARVTRRNGLSPIWVLNVFEETPESVVELFKKLDSAGLAVQAVEMANEPYWDGRTFNDVKSYIRFSRPIAEALRKQYPHVKIGACFAPLGNSANYEAIWNTPLAKETWFDAIIFHDYYGGQGFALEKGNKVPVAAMLHPEAMIEKPVSEFAKLLPGTPLWFTEWNVGIDGLDQWKNTGAELQFIAAMFVSLLEHRESIDIACFHAIYDARFGAMFIDNESGRVEKNASYELFRLIGTSLAGAKSLRPISFATTDLRGFATQQGDDIRVLVLNRGETDRDVSLPASCTGELVRHTIDCRPDRVLPRSTSITESFPAEIGRVTLPAHSVSLIGRRQALEIKPKSADDDNLFPRRPDLMLWYAPFAGEQPRFDSEGVYEVDLGKFKDKSLAVVKMNLASSKLEPNREYSVEFEAKIDGEGGLIVKLPNAETETDSDDQKSVFSLLSRDYTSKRYVFRYDPEKNGGEVTFVFLQKLIEQGPRVSFRDFRIRISE